MITFPRISALLGPVLLIGAALFAFADEEPPVDAKKIVFIAGKPSHGPGEHEHRAGSMLLADHLRKSGLPVETEVVTGGWPSDESVFEGASAVVIYGMAEVAIRRSGSWKRSGNWPRMVSESAASTTPWRCRPASRVARSST